MRVRLLPLCCAMACGRLGFDDVAPNTPLDAPPDTVVDAAPGDPNLCDLRTSGALSLTSETPIKLRATALSTGYAVAIQTDLERTYMAELDLAGNVVSTTLPFSPNYSLHGISQVGDRPFVYVHTGGVGYIKLLLPGWEAYETGPSGDAKISDPQQARLPGGTTAVFGTYSIGILTFSTIDANNGQVGTVDYAPEAVFASFGSTPTGVRVVVQRQSQLCETFEIAPDGTTGPRHTFSPCVEPRLATLGEEGAIVHRTSAGGTIAVHQIPAIAADPGTTVSLEPGTNARIAAIDGAIWVGYLRTTGEARLVRFVGDVMTTRDLPTVASSFDLIPTGAFWVTGTGELHAGTPCL